MRIPALLPLLALLAPAGLAAEGKTDQKVVKAVRALLSARKTRDRNELLQDLLKRTDLDWPSVKEGFKQGAYYRAPMVTGYGDQHSGRHLGIRFLGAADGKARGFSLYIPKSYDAKRKIPVLFYLHHGAGAAHGGAERAGLALTMFRKICEDAGMLFVAPYTTAGAEWWTPDGRKLVEWTLTKVKERYNIDEDRIGLMGALDGADSVWHLGQEMPDTWSCLMPMSGDAYDASSMIQPVCLGTLDRMDVLIGVPGVTKSSLGNKNIKQFLEGLQPMFKQHMRITTAVYTRAQGDFRYLDQIRELVAAFVIDKKRRPHAGEVDIDTTRPGGQRSLWLRSEGYDPDGMVAGNFPSTLLRWTPPKRGGEPKKRIGVQLGHRWDLGITVSGVPEGPARNAKILAGDILVAVDGVAITREVDIHKLVEKRNWRDEVRLSLIREVKKSAVGNVERQQRNYLTIRRKVSELIAQGKRPPRNLDDLLDEEDDPDEDEGDGDDGCSEIQISDGPEKAGTDPEKAGGGRALVSEETVMYAFDRWVRLRRPMGGGGGKTLLRADFGAGWDRKHAHEGVRVVNIVPGGHASRSGFLGGDVIVEVLGTQIRNLRDLRRAFSGFRYEKEPEGERFVEFSIKRQGADKQWQEKTITVRWEPVESFRVDAQWNKKEWNLAVLVRKARGFTLYFTDEVIKPGQDFHLYVNGVPYRDLVDRASAPDYPEIRAGTDPMVRDEVHRLRQRRAKVPGWKPDLAWAIRDNLARRDRSLVLGAKRSYDLTRMIKGAEEVKKLERKRRADRGNRIKDAWERHRSRE